LPGPLGKTLQLTDRASRPLDAVYAAIFIDALVVKALWQRT